MNLAWRRRAIDRLATGLTLGFLLLALTPLVSLLWEVGSRGVPVVSWAFLTQLPAGPLGGGGIYNAIIGTGIVVGLGTAFGAPVGIAAGIFLSEYGQTRFGSVVRIGADVMAGIPSIVAGLFAAALIVDALGLSYSAYAAGAALAVIMLPVVTRTTEESLRTVPATYREAALALGIPRWRAIISVVLPSALSGILTGVLLAVARIAGETAPLLLTMLASFYLVVDPSQSVLTLPYVVYDYAKSAYVSRQEQAWGAAVVLLGLVLFINIGVRLLALRRTRKTA